MAMADGTFNRIRGVTQQAAYTQAVNNAGGKGGTGKHTADGSSEKFNGMMNSKKDKKRDNKGQNAVMGRIPLRNNRPRIKPQLMNLMKQKQFEMSERLKEDSAEQKNKEKAKEKMRIRRWKKLLETAKISADDIERKIRDLLEI